MQFDLNKSIATIDILRNKQLEVEQKIEQIKSEVVNQHNRMNKRIAIQQLELDADRLQRELKHEEWIVNFHLERQDRLSLVQPTTDKPQAQPQDDEKKQTQTEPIQPIQEDQSDNQPVVPPTVHANLLSNKKLSVRETIEQRVDQLQDHLDQLRDQTNEQVDLLEQLVNRVKQQQKQQKVFQQSLDEFERLIESLDL